MTITLCLIKQQRKILNFITLFKSFTLPYPSLLAFTAHVGTSLALVGMDARSLGEVTGETWLAAATASLC